MMTEIITLGCGGGRHQTIDQSFRTGGIRIHSGANIHLDPGPGALLLTNQLGLDPLDLDGVVVSHSHPDHYADAGVLVEAMARGNSTGGRFVGNKSAIYGTEELGPAISEYYKRKVGEVVFLEPGKTHDIESLTLEATPTKHSDSTGIGLKIQTDGGLVGYTGDTQYFNGLPEIFEDCRILFANVTRPGGKRIRGHLCSQDLEKILEIVEPDIAVMLHMGMLFLKHPPKKEAARIEDQTGVRTIPGFVGTKIKMEGEVKVEREYDQTGLGKFSK